MPRPLGTEEFAILQEHVDARDRIAYYEQLGEWGYRYGELALGVVTNDTSAGALANAFFLDQAGDALGVRPALDPDALADMGVSLMQRDLRARIDSGEVAQGRRLSVDDIQEYHTQAFVQATGLDRDTARALWTPSIALDVLDTDLEREQLWDTLLARGPVGNYGALLVNAVTESVDDWRDLPELVGYIGTVSALGLGAVTTRSTDLGPYRVSFSDGLVIGGSYRNDDGRFSFDAANPLAGANGNDVVMGFDGTDLLSGSGGEDTLYGGEGRDTLYASSEDDWQDDVTAGDSLRGGDGGDHLYLGSGDRGRGEDGADRVRLSTASFAEAAWMDGGAGADILDLSDSEEGVEVRWADATEDDRAFSDAPHGQTVLVSAADGGGAAHRGTSFERLFFGGEHDNVDAGAFGGFDDAGDGPVGTSVAFAASTEPQDRLSIHAGGGADRIEGSDLGDLLIGGLGYDTIIGGDGDDVLVTHASADGDRPADAVAPREHERSYVLGGEGGDVILITSDVLSDVNVDTPSALSGDGGAPVVANDHYDFEAEESLARGYFDVLIEDSDSNASIIVAVPGDDGGWSTHDLTSFSATTNDTDDFVEITYTSEHSNLYFSFYGDYEGDWEYNLQDPLENQGTYWDAGPEDGWVIFLNERVGRIDHQTATDQRNDFEEDNDVFVGVIRLLDVPIEGFLTGVSSGLDYEVAGDFLRISDPADPGAEPLIVALDGTSYVEDGVSTEPTRGDGGAGAYAGSWGNDMHDAGGGADTLEGSEGRDSLAGSDGSDLLDGGAGDDVLYGDAPPIEWGFA